MYSALSAAHTGIRHGLVPQLGAVITEKGVQFAVFSSNATAIDLLLFDNAEDDSPAHRIPLTPTVNSTGKCWTGFVEGIGEGQLYLYQADGPFAPLEGQRFRKNIFLLDPYAKALTGKQAWKFNKHRNTDSGAAGIPKCVVISDNFDWQGDRFPHHPLWKTIIYEAHVKGLTCHSSAVKRYAIQSPGTYSAVINMIPYLKNLGITSLELLPVFEFDEYEFGSLLLPSGRRKVNYWGYSTAAFFAPKGNYAVSNDGPTQVREFKTMVRELHKAGIEIILDVVFNHTGEGNQMGPTFSFRGLDNSVYYTLAPRKNHYTNYSGCGNTVNCNHPVVQDFIIHCLRYWHGQMHVDGFRFDLASILARDSQGNLMDKPPIVDRIADDPMLYNAKIIAEAWDAGGGYQVGGFGGERWAEWNDKFRNDVRSFWKGDAGKIQSLATRISGSSDLYSNSGKTPQNSINYITSHDGFTMYDLVSYNGKHNEDNGEDNRDGCDNNISCNWGDEGDTPDAVTRVLRSRILRNFWSTLLLSSGIPMILGGDEIGRSQKGNNNAYCQDNEISWHDYSLMKSNADLLRFARRIIAFRQLHPALQRRSFFSGEAHNGAVNPDIQWFDENGKAIDWQRKENIMALLIDGDRTNTGHSVNDDSIAAFFNATPQHVQFTLPPVVSRQWYRFLDTSLAAPNDISEKGGEVPVNMERRYTLGPWSMAVLVSGRV